MQQEHVETSRVSATIPINNLFPPQPLQTWGLDPLFASYHKMFVVLIRNYIEVQENNAFGKIRREEEIKLSEELKVLEQ